ncbi:MAG: c-type cytochrome, partial [Candidatus Methylomirabilales bacterium]
MRIAGGIRLFLAVAVFLVGVFGGYSEGGGEDGKDIFAEKCAGCHSVSGPPAQTFAERRNRKGPDLTGAGSKFQKAWLQGWLQKPTTIRPAGVMYLNHIRAGPKNEVVDRATLTPHEALSTEEAKVVAQYLMTLTDQRVGHGVVKVGGKLTRMERKAGKARFQKRFGCY